MNLNEIYYNDKNINKLKISIEIFPPNDFSDENVNKLINELEKIEKYKPTLISVTYNSNLVNTFKKYNTLNLAKIIKEKLNYNVMPHFVCINTKKEFINEYIKKIEELNLENILALRGDILPNIKKINSEYKYAYELIELIKQTTNLTIASSGYPQKHPEAKSEKCDLENLKLKIEKGAKVIYTQLFFENEKFYRYMEKLEKNNINVPTIPGIMPIANYMQVSKIANLCKIKIPEKLEKNLNKHLNYKEAIFEIGIEFATRQVEELIKFGVKGIHFYMLNKSKSLIKILENIKY